MRSLRWILLLLISVLLLSLTSCGEMHELLYSVEADGLTYCIRGTGTRPRQIVVKLGDEIVWSRSVRVDRKVGNYKNCYGFEIMDLNFDGEKDIVLTQKLNKDVADVSCWLWNEQKNRFVLSEELSKLNNVKSDSTLKAIFAFDHTYTYEKAFADIPDTYVSTDIVTKYLWVGGKLVPERRVSLAYDSEHKFYVYSISEYDESTKSFSPPDDVYLSKEEYQSRDFSFFYYFK